LSNSSSSSSFSDSDFSEDDSDVIGGKPKTQRKSASWKKRPRERELHKRRIRREHPVMLEYLEYWKSQVEYFEGVSASERLLGEEASKWRLRSYASKLGNAKKQVQKIEKQFEILEGGVEEGSSVGSKGQFCDSDSDREEDENIGGKPKTQRKSATWKRKPRERELWKRRLRRAHPESRDLLKQLKRWDRMLQVWTDLLDEEGWHPPRVNTEEDRQRYQTGVNKALRKIREIEDKLKVLEEESEKSLASIGGKRGAEEQEEKRKKRRKGPPATYSSLFYDPDTQTAHPYVQYKTNLLVKRRGYSPGVANKMMLWNVMPPNFTMPFALLLRILRGFHATLVPGYAISPFGVGAALAAEPSLRSVTTSTTTATRPSPGTGLSTNTTSSSFGSSVLPSDYF